MNILIVAGGTGGHVYPALSIAKEFNQKGFKISWIGKKDSLEESICVEEQFSFYALKSKGFQGKSFLKKINSLYFFILSLFASFFIVRKIRPDFIVSTGGYTSLAPSIIGSLFCPLFIHEQNSVAGLTNKILHRFSKLTFEAFPNTFNTLKPKLRFVGNPVREEIFGNLKNTDTNESIFKILVLGGSQGSKQINDIQKEILTNEKIPPHWSFIHQVGKLESTELRLAYECSGIKFEIKEYIDDMGEAYNNCDIVISRSGAMTISEICASGRPSILLPLPWSSNNHQYHNAKFLEDRGAAELTDLSVSSYKDLFELLIEIERDHNKRLKMADNASAVFPKGTSKKIFKSINESLSIQTQ